MAPVVIAVMAGLVLVYALLAKRLDEANITSPMLSVAAGVVVFSASALDVDSAMVHLIAELTLAIVLFHDASTVKITQLRHDTTIAARLLLIGFPLALLATYLVTRAIEPAIGVAGAVLLTASITPTDAGLGAATILDPEVPVRVRRGLNVESGLNDGLATPVVLLALAALVAEEGGTEPTILQVGVVPVVTALACAIVVSLAAAWCMDRSRIRRLSGHRGRAVATLALPLLLFGLADVIGANVFITAFVGGLTFSAACITVDEEEETTGLLEVAADLLGFVVWFMAGGLLLVVFDEGFEWSWLLLAILALTVLRAIPVFLALLGTGFRWPTVAFLGWFGPRGLATIVFALLAVEELPADSPVVAPLAGVVAFTVTLSVLAHGLSAGPLSARYGGWVSRTHAPIEQLPSVEPLPTRGRRGGF